MVPADAHLAKVVRGITGIRRFLIVIEVIPRAVEGYVLGVIHLQPPAGDVHEMRAVILHFAAAVQPVPVPVVMHEVILVRPVRARALPEFPALFAEPLGHLHKLAFADAATGAAVVASRKGRLPNLTSLHTLDALDDTRLTAPLVAHLHFLFVLLRRGHYQLRLARVMASGFLDVYVLARFHREDSHRCVPKIRRGNRHGINRFIIEDASKIIDTLRIFCLRKLGERGLGAVHAAGHAPTVHVTQIRHLAVGRLEILDGMPHATAQTDDAGDDFLLGILGLENSGECKGGSSSAAYELTTGEGRFHRRASRLRRAEGLANEKSRTKPRHFSRAHNRTRD